jgi:hypothetical protein
MLAVVSDSSPLIYLTRLAQFGLLRQLHDRVLIPQAVWDEVAVGGQGLPESENLRHAVAAGWIQVKSPTVSLPKLSPQAAALGRGELEAIALAKELGALLLTDDSDGREVAESIGVKVSGTVGLLIRARAEGHITRVRPFLDKLRAETNFRMSESLYRQALAESGELASATQNPAPPP